MIVRRKSWRNVYAMNLALRQRTKLDLDEGLMPRGCFGRMFTWSHGLMPHISDDLAYKRWPALRP